HGAALPGADRGGAGERAEPDLRRGGRPHRAWAGGGAVRTRPPADGGGGGTGRLLVLAPAAGAVVHGARGSQRSGADGRAAPAQGPPLAGAWCSGLPLGGAAAARSARDRATTAAAATATTAATRSEEHTSELQSRENLVC